MTEERWFEVEVTVTGSNPFDTVSIVREYKSQNAASAANAARELLGGLSETIRGRLRPVSESE